MKKEGEPSAREDFEAVVQSLESVFPGETRLEQTRNLSEASARKFTKGLVQALNIAVNLVDSSKDSEEK